MRRLRSNIKTSNFRYFDLLINKASYCKSDINARIQIGLQASKSLFRNIVMIISAKIKKELLKSKKLDKIRTVERD